MPENCNMVGYNSTPKEIETIFNEIKTIAIVGLSPKVDRDSNRVGKYLQSQGYKIIPVNPTQNQILGEKSYPSLLDIPQQIDAVDIFRKSEAVPEIVNEAINKGTSVIWMQLGVVNNEAAKDACEANIKVVMNKCMMREHLRITQENK